MKTKFKTILYLFLSALLILNTVMSFDIRLQAANINEELETSDISEEATEALDLKAGAEEILDESLPATESQIKEAEEKEESDVDADIRAAIRENIGDEWETITVSTAQDLMDVASECVLDSWSLNKVIKLNNDISLEGADFEGIPTFGGIWDGQGYTVSGINIANDRSYTGFFDYVQKDAIIIGLNVEGNITEDDECFYVGGLCGYNEGIIINCSFKGNLRAGDYLGGIAGFNELNGQIYDCETSGKISGEHFVGGIAGENKGNINRCVNSSNVNTEHQESSFSISNAGNINLLNILDQKLTEEYDSGVDLSTFDIGGIAGISYGVIANSTNDGNVGYDKVGSNIGGIAGRQSGYIYNCTNNAKVMGKSDVGGIVGQAEPYVTIDLDSDTSAQLKSSIEELHDLIDKTLKDVGSSSDIISSRLTVMQQLTGGAINDTDYIVNSTANYANGLSNAANTTGQKLQAVAEDLRSTKGTLEDLAENIRNMTTSDIQVPEVKKEDIKVDIAFPTLDSNYFNHVSSLSGNLRSLNDNYGLLITESNNANQTVVKDLIAVNNQFEKVLILYSDAVEKALDNSFEDVYTDESVQVLDTCIDGCINKCYNNGAVSSDLNAGGIAGNMSIESDISILDRFKDINSLIKGGSYISKCVIRSSDNYSDIEGYKSYVGGICGRSETGVISECISYADIMGEDCSYVGGIAGISKSYIRNCAFRGNVYAKEYAGGITGDGYNILNSIALAGIYGCDDWYGAIAGNVQKDGLVRNNYYISDNLAGINKVSYDMKAQSVKEEDLGTLEEVFVPADLDKIKITFVLKDEETDEKTILKTMYIPYNSSVKESDYPDAPGKEGYYASWNYKELDNVVLDTKIYATMTKYVSSLAGPEYEELHQSQIMVDGQFKEGDELVVNNLLEENTFEDINSYSIGYSNIIIPDDGLDKHTIRFNSYLYGLNLEDAFTVHILEGEEWVPVENVSVNGTSAVFEAEGNDITFKVYCTAINKYIAYYVLIPLIVIVILLILLIVVIIIAIVKKKTIYEALSIVFKSALKKTNSSNKQDLFYHAKETRSGEEYEGEDWREIAKEWNISPDMMAVNDINLNIDSLDNINEIIDSAVDDIALATKAKLVCEELFVVVLKTSRANYLKFYCGKVGNDVIVAFWDDGNGFDPTAERKLIDPDSANGGGSLGLNLAKKLATQWIYTRRNRENCNFIRINK
ncbi:MAG: hypothetical protein K5659_02210 [Lachnospiraceae bacterium]|nr:hypothetical protein [Lachnospiraceae bacterium]